MVWVKILLVLALVIGGFWSLNREPPREAPEVLIDRSDATQRQRANAIEKLVAGGVVQKLEQGLSPVLWTGPAFAALSLDENTRTAAVTTAGIRPSLVAAGSSPLPPIDPFCGLRSSLSNPKFPIPSQSGRTIHPHA
jgi:hypothetical protein